MIIQHQLLRLILYIISGKYVCHISNIFIYFSHFDYIIYFVIFFKHVKNNHFHVKNNTLTYPVILSNIQKYRHGIENSTSWRYFICLYIKKQIYTEQMFIACYSHYPTIFFHNPFYALQSISMFYIIPLSCLKLTI